MTEAEYRANKALNYSLLSAFSSHPSKVAPDAEERKPGQAMILGSALDCLIFRGGRAYANEYYVSKPDMKKPDFNTKGWEAVRWMFEHRNDDLFLQLDDQTFLDKLALAATEAIGVYQSIKDPQKRIERLTLNEDYMAYFDDCLMAEGKTILTADQDKSIRELSKCLRHHEYTKKYFNQGEQTEIYFQTPATWIVKVDGKEFNAKGLYDILILIPSKKIALITDLKSTSLYASEFKYQYTQYNYYLQQSWYTNGLREVAKGNGILYATSDEPIQEGEVPETINLTGYKVQPMSFIVGSFLTPEAPIVYPMGEDAVLFGERGGYKVGDTLFVSDEQNTPLGSGKYYKGWKQLISEYNWHLENNLWDFTRDIYDNKGKVKLKFQNTIK